MEWNAPQELQGNERKGGKAFRSLLDSVGPKWLGCLSKSKQMLGVIGEFATEILCLSYFLFLKTLKLHQITMLENTSLSSWLSCGSWQMGKCPFGRAKLLFAKTRISNTTQRGLIYLQRMFCIWLELKGGKQQVKRRLKNDLVFLQMAP